MLRPQRNGSKLKGYFRSNSYSVPAKVAKESAKPTSDKMTLERETYDLPVETLKKPLNNYVATDFAKTKKEDNWVKPLVSISLDNASEIKAKIINSNDAETTKVYPINPPYNTSQMADTIKKNQTLNDEGNVYIKLTKEIKSAAKPETNKTQPVQVNNFLRHLDDGNSIISAYLKNNYGELPKVSKIEKE